MTITTHRVPTAPTLKPTATLAPEHPYPTPGPEAVRAGSTAPATGGQKPQAVLRLVVGHPCRLTGEVLAQSLGGSGDFAAIKLVHGLEQVSDVVAQWRPHVVLLAGVAGQPQLEMAKEIAATHRCGVVVVATEPSRAAVDTALRQGNISLLSHQAGLAHLLHAVRGTAMGCPTIDTSFAPTGDDAAGCTLTPRERDVLLLTTEGLPVKEIATRLFLTGGTVRNISSSAIRKLGARNRYEAARQAHDKGWL
ncbi:response regulator transcription factor [Arthrobacter sp. NEB 688]|uniref:helix-turn-helix transcriptional regulator n=1 Tax=Arthrobacter sp. NEB 688 TaxID=904039 RepID=UPI0015656564|nr:response regulator transcription factor [Arthrobacter sp. NEB 688]QKE83134.1 response regulator transcription factor [Arthrobacter sp. NEB 688]